jgi:hypothetical protein
MSLGKVNLKFTQSTGGDFFGPDQLCFPGILSLMIFQKEGAVLDPDLEAEKPWGHPPFRDLMHFQPGFPPGKTPGAFMEPKPG